MGLDMYLYVKETKYTSSLREQENIYPSELKELEQEVSARNFASCETEIYYQVGYWRKANAIHKWFVDNCGEGVDECQRIYVPIEKLKELGNLVDEVLQNKDKAQELLPTEDGFFFGSINYDEWYFEDLEYTKHIVDKLLKFLDGKDYELVYQASW